MLVLVFSKDRAMQLDATLRSFARHANTVVRPTVLYRASTQAMVEQYQTVAHENPAAVMIEETNFQTQVLDLLQMRQHRHVLLLVDDCLFVRSFSLGEIVSALDADPQAIGFSLRLGENTTHCYPIDAAQAVPVMTRPTAHIRRFAWVGSQCDFGYPLEISSSLYRTEDVILPSFSGPNDLESRLAATRPTKPYLLCFDRSVAFCNPVNIVQSVFANRAGHNAVYSAEALARRFDVGDRIDVESYDGLVPSACHQEVPLVFGRRTDLL